MTAATIWFGWWLCQFSGSCLPMKSLSVCLQTKNTIVEVDQPGPFSSRRTGGGYCINNETGERK